MIVETKREIVERKAEEIQKEKVKKILTQQSDFSIKHRNILRTLIRRMVQSKSICQTLSNNIEWLRAFMTKEPVDSVGNQE